ncbi:MAG: T9SS type A sorting domain-containing protein, partial [Flavobacteriales bacterium]
VNPFSSNQGKVRLYQGPAIVTGTPTISTAELAIHPNPASDHITVRSELAVHRLDLFDLSGGYVVGAVSQSTLDLSELAHGPYFVRVTFVDGGVAHARLVRQ